MRRLILTFFSLLALNSAASASTTHGVDSVANRYIADEVIAVVGNNIILLSDLNESKDNLLDRYKSQGMTPKGDLTAEAFEGLLVQKFLAAQAAIDSLPLSESEIARMSEAEVAKLVEKYGSVQAVEERYSRPIFTIRDIVLRRKVTEQYLAQSMQQQAQKDITITPIEVKRFVSKMNPDSIPEIPEQYIIANIVKLPQLTDDARLDLKEKLLGFRKRIIDGEVSFRALASMYSDDPMSAIKGGEMAPQPKDAFVGPFADALEKLEPGQISDVVETEFGFHIIELIGKNGDNYHCRHILLQLKFDQEQLNNARAQLDSVVGVIRAGDLTFEKAALEFSDDKDSKNEGGVAVNAMYENYGGPRMKSKTFFKEELGPTYDKLRNLKEGEISNSFVDMDMDKRIEVAKIVKLVEIIPAHKATLKEDYDMLEQLVEGQKKAEVFDKWVEEKVQKMYIFIKEPYRNLPMKNKIWVK